MGIGYGIIALVFMIVIHEYGHFIAAKLVGVRVERFSVGFGRVLLRYRGKETEYVLSLVPLGGYVKMKGEYIDEELDNTEGAFFAQPVYKRMIIVFAGPFFNIASAVFFLAFAYMIGVSRLAPNVGEVINHSEASVVGIMPHDTIVAVNGKRVSTWSEMSRLIKLYPNKRVKITLLRNGKRIELTVKPSGRYIKTLLGKREYVGFLGIAPSGKTVVVRYSPLRALYYGAVKTFYVAKITVEGIIALIKRTIPAREIGGPIMIVKVASKAAHTGLGPFLLFVAIISVNLGILNLLPIPILDGGHLVFFGIEAVRGKPLDERTQVILQNIGLLILIAIMVFAFYNDFRRYGVIKFIGKELGVFR